MDLRKFINERAPKNKASPWLLKEINHALERDESDFRQFFIGTE
jgi:hypothetical protein